MSALTSSYPVLIEWRKGPTSATLSVSDRCDKHKRPVREKCFGRVNRQFRAGCVTVAITVCKFAPPVSPAQQPPVKDATLNVHCCGFLWMHCCSNV